MRITALLIWLVLVSCAAAEVKMYPPTDQAIGAVTSEIVGRWIVFRANPFGVVESQPVTIGGDPGCLWAGEAGTYTAVLVPTDTAAPIETGTVVLGGTTPDPGPGPGPGPDPDPDPPGPRTVVVIAEEDKQTAYREVAIDVLRDYALGNGHTYRLFDPDDKDSSGQTPALLQEYLLTAKSVGLPALLVVDSKGTVTASKLPDAGRTVQTAKAAGESAIKSIKDAGG